MSAKEEQACYFKDELAKNSARATADKAMRKTLATALASDTRWYTDNREATNFRISTAEELAGLAVIVNSGTGKLFRKRENFSGKTVTLAGNIDLSRYENWIPIGLEWDIEFAGTFDGGGYTISNLTINRPCTEYSLGLFGFVSSGKVENLGLDGVNITGDCSVGGVAGVLRESSMTNCYSIGEVRGTNGVGGLVGTVVVASSITCSYSVCTVSGTDSNIGGLAGSVGSDCSLTNCYASGTVSGKEIVGGLAGLVGDYTSGNACVVNCYSTGAVSGTGNCVGGVAGIVYWFSKLAHCYTTCAVSGDNWVGGIVGSLETKISVTDCAALNTEVKGIGVKKGRVIGHIHGTIPSKLKNNVAYTGIKNRGGRATWGKKGANDTGGADITAAEIQTSPTIGNRFNPAGGWTTESGKLPGLGGKAVEMPEHLR